MARSGIVAIFGLIGLISPIGLGIWIWRRIRRAPIVLAEPLDTGAVLSGLSTAFRSDCLPVVLLAVAVIGVPRFLSALLLGREGIVPGQPLPGNPAAFVGMTLGATAVAMFIGLVFYIAAFRYLVLRDLGGQPRLGDSLARVPALILPAIGLVIVELIGGFVASVFLLWPAMLLLLTWSVATPVLVVEEAGVIESLRRSHRLTTGSRGRILLAFTVWFVLGCVVLGIASAVQRLVGGATGIAGPLVQAVMSTILALFGAGFASTLYVKLLEIHGGRGTNGNLAEIFA